MKRILLAMAVAAVLAAVPAQAQKKNAKSNAQPYNGGINTEMMQQIKKSYCWAN